MNFRDIVDTILAASQADQTEIVCIRQDDSLTRFANNYIHQNVTETSASISVRCAIGTRVGIAVSNTGNPDALRLLAARACEFARLQPENPDFHGFPGPAVIREVPTVDSRVASCTPQERATGVGIACRKAAERGYTAAGSMTTGITRLGVANSNGVFAEHEFTVADASTVVMSSTSSGWAQSSGWTMDAIHWEALADEAIAKARMGEDPDDQPPGEYTVVLDPYATADLIEMLSMDGMSALAFQEDRSWMNGRIGQQVMSPSISIVDDGYDPEGIPMPFDFEGQPRSMLAIVENGVCRGPVYDSYTAGREPGKHSTGHATPPSPTDRYGPLPMNLFLLPGESNVEEMIRSTKSGLYITRFWYTRVVHPRDVIITGMTRDGTFRIHDGEIAGGVKSMRFTQSYLDALSHTAALSIQSKVLKSGIGTVSVPAVKLDGFRFTSGTR